MNFLTKYILIQFNSERTSGLDTISELKYTKLKFYKIN